MKRILPIAILCSALMLSSCATDSKTQVEEEVVLRSVEVTRIGTDTISSDFAYSGKAAAIKEISIIPMIPGKVTYAGYSVGDAVASGATLFRVDTSSLETSLKSAEASLAIAQLGYDSAKKTYDNNFVLFEEGIISEADMDKIIYAYDSAEANINALHIQIESIQKSISDCTVTAPMSGVITARNIEVGGFATQSLPSYTIMDLSSVKVEVGISEQMVNSVSVGDEVSVKMTAVSAQPLTGIVSTINPAANHTGTYTVDIRLNNSDGLIKSGMLAEVRFTTEISEDTLILSQNTVISKDGEIYVFILNDDNTVKKVSVVTGIETGENIEIVSGLSEGDLVITRGQSYLTDGERVNVSNADAVGIAQNRMKGE